MAEKKFDFIRIGDVEKTKQQLMEEFGKEKSDFIVRAGRTGGDRQAFTDAAMLYAACEHVKAKKILEIGAARGSSSMLLGDYARGNNAHVHSVDPCCDLKSWYENIRREGLVSFITRHQDYSWMLNMNNIELPLDILFIDGDHKTTSAITDFVRFYPKVRQGGIIMFHDYCGAGGYKKKVREAVRLIRQDYKLELFGTSEPVDKGIIAFIK